MTSCSPSRVQGVSLSRTSASVFLIKLTYFVDSSRLFQDSGQESRLAQDQKVVILGHHQKQFALVHASMQLLAARLP
jgi:hypothetical protein